MNCQLYEGHVWYCGWGGGANAWQMIFSFLCALSLQAARFGTAGATDKILDPL